MGARLPTVYNSRQYFETGVRLLRLWERRSGADILSVGKIGLE
jgi:hypothetical protein